MAKGTIIAVEPDLVATLSFPASHLTKSQTTYRVSFRGDHAPPWKSKFMLRELVFKWPKNQSKKPKTTKIFWGACPQTPLMGALRVLGLGVTPKKYSDSPNCPPL